VFKIDDVHNTEKAVVGILNIIGWNLRWTGGNYEHYDCRGYTPKGYECCIEMKFRNNYYENKMLEKYKYDKLQEMDKEILKFYFVNDPKANYLFWIGGLPKDLEQLPTSSSRFRPIKMPEPVKIWCPQTTIWNNKKKVKEVYLLNEKLAIQKNIN